MTAMTIFERQLDVPVPRDVLHDWHMRQGAFERLSAPWESIRHVHADPVANGAKRVFEVKKGGVWLRWIADHRDVVPPERFTDVQERGPFKRWAHTHRFETRGEARSRLIDHIDYAVPMGGLGRALAGSSARIGSRSSMPRCRLTSFRFGCTCSPSRVG